MLKRRVSEQVLRKVGVLIGSSKRRNFRRLDSVVLLLLEGSVHYRRLD